MKPTPSRGNKVINDFPKSFSRFVYRQNPVSKGVYEIGVWHEPRISPEEWCDMRICEGFWGDRYLVEEIVDKLNQNTHIDPTPSREEAKDYAVNYCKVNHIQPPYFGTWLDGFMKCFHWITATADPEGK
jgi:hypothetical protein